MIVSPRIRITQELRLLDQAVREWRRVQREIEARRVGLNVWDPTPDWTNEDNLRHTLFGIQLLTRQGELMHALDDLNDNRHV